MTLENVFNINSVKELVKTVINEAKELTYAINVELKCDEERFKRYAIKFLLHQEEPKTKTRAQKIEEILEILAKNKNYQKIYHTLLNSYNYIRKIAGKENYNPNYNPKLKQENPFHSSGN